MRAILRYASILVWPALAMLGGAGAGVLPMLPAPVLAVAGRAIGAALVGILLVVLLRTIAALVWRAAARGRDSD